MPFLRFSWITLRLISLVLGSRFSSWRRGSDVVYITGLAGNLSGLEYDAAYDFPAYCLAFMFHVPSIYKSWYFLRAYSPFAVQYFRRFRAPQCLGAPLELLCSFFSTVIDHPKVPRFSAKLRRARTGSFALVRAQADGQSALQLSAETMLGVLA